MGSRRYLTERDPEGLARYSLHADSRLRAAFLGRDLAGWGESYVALVRDDTGPGLDRLHGVRKIAELVEELTHELVVGVLAAGGTMEQVAETLDISPARATQLYGELWDDRGAQHAAARDDRPIQNKRNGWNLDQLDHFCEVRGHGAFAVTGGLVYPHVPEAEVRSRAEVRDDEQRVVKEAEFQIEIAAGHVEYEAALAAALKRLNRRPGTARSPLWNNRKPPYVIARDGVLLGVAARHAERAEGDPERVVRRWSVSHAPEFTLREYDVRFVTLQDAIQYLEHRPGAPSADPQPTE